MNTNYINYIARQLKLRVSGVTNTLELLIDEKATIPFIARYRKERTGSLDEVQIMDIKTAYEKLVELDKRRASVIKSIEEQGKMTNALKKRLKESMSLTEIEDLYLPYKRKRKTRASIARSKGLEPLANLIAEQREGNILQKAKAYLSDEVADIEEALQGARDIIAEQINESQDARNTVRNAFERYATVRSKIVRGKDDAAAKFKDYFKFEQTWHKCPSHRLLAILRGEAEGLLRVYLKPEEEDATPSLNQQFVKGRGAVATQMELAITDAYKRLLAPSIENEYRKIAKEIADEEAIQVFAENLRQLLLAAPLGEKRVLALDPGYRTGCKVVCLDEQGKLLHNTAIYPHPPQNQAHTAKRILKELVRDFAIDAIAVGNGTAGRESKQLVDGIDFGKPVSVFMVNENGASIYSASAIAREEFPKHDATVRGSVSIGRRLMDPLAELVKIDAKSIGVGQYQHDVNQTSLKNSLDAVVESCVNTIGINVNTASKHLLTYVSGLGPKLAENIVIYRNEHGAFDARKQLMAVPRMGDKAFEQSIGFLRIRDAKHPLDNTGVHPESYHIVEKMAKDLRSSVGELIKNPFLRRKIDLKIYVTKQVGLPTLQDILKELEKPGLDPRGEAQTFSFAQHIKSMEDVQEGMIIPGIVTNITKFGAFVDIGVKQDGLVHISQLANKFVRDPADVVKLSQHVEVKVMEVDRKRGRIHLSMKEV